jgi:Na+/H+-dicarboxylate symporter
MNAFRVIALSDFFLELLLVLLIPAFFVTLPLLVEALEKTILGKEFVTIVAATLLLFFCSLPLGRLIIREIDPPTTLLRHSSH